MCGIIGSASSKPITDDMAAGLRRGLNSLSRRGPDQLSERRFAQDHCHFGHARLSIIDLHERSNQPMGLPDTDDWIVYNGEIYNFRALRSELQEEGWTFSTEGDTEVLLKAIAHWGVEQACARVDGMFAFGVYSARSNTLTLARDRYGEKPLYWSIRDNLVTFASTATAVAATLGSRPELSGEAMQLFLSYGFVPAPWSIFEGVSKVSPGEVLEFSLDGTVRLESRIMLPLPHGQVSDDQPTLDDIQEALDKSVARRLVSDRPVGLFLSGGIDSSCVAASLKRNNASIECFTFKSNAPGYDESADAQLVARAAGLELTFVEMDDKDVVDGYDALPDAFDEPHADASAIPLMRLSQVASRSAKVVLTGDGGDEVFCGYHRHLALLRTLQVQKVAPAFVRKLAAGVLDADAFIRLAQLARRTAGGDDTQMLAVRIRKLAASLRSSDLIGAYLNAIASADVGDRDGRLRDMLASVAEEPYALQKLDCAFYLPGGVLTKTDRSTMYHSIEGRTPYLQADLHAMSWRLPQEAHIGPSGKKLVLRQLAKRAFGAAFADRPKRGFDLPIADWVAGQLKGEIDAGRSQFRAYCRSRGFDWLLDANDTSAERAWRESTLGRWLHRKDYAT